jgi:sugar phosphate isomerase/epimerase
LLDQNGLVCCGTHIGIDPLLGDQLKKTVDFNKTLGNKFLIVASMGGDRLGTLEAIKKTAKLFSEIAEKVKSDGMRVGYHAHGGDFKKITNHTAWDLFFTNASRDVVMQLDVGNCKEGGGDPVAVLKTFPGRAATIHLKEFGGKPGAVIGEGKAPWAEIFQACERPGGTQWYIVEQETYATKPLESVKQCFEALKKMGKC